MDLTDPALDGQRASWQPRLERRPDALDRVVVRAAAWRLAALPVTATAVYGLAARRTGRGGVG